jgi:hypothetical protein
MFSDPQTTNHQKLLSLMKTGSNEDFIVADDRLIGIFHREIFPRLVKLDKLLEERSAEALKLSNVQNTLPVYLANAKKMSEDLNYKSEKTLIALHNSKNDNKAKDDYVFFMKNSYLGLKADLDALENEIALGSAPIIVSVPANDFLARGPAASPINITNLVAKWPAEVRNSLILNLQKEALSQISTFNPILDAWKKIKSALDKKLKFKELVDLMSREQLDVRLNGPSKNKDKITDKAELIRILQEGVGSLVEFRPFLAKNNAQLGDKKQAFDFYAGALRKKLNDVKLPMIEKKKDLSYIMSKVYELAKLRGEEQAINLIIIYNAIWLDNAKDRAGIKRIEDVIYYYFSVASAEKKINGLMRSFIGWNSQGADVGQIKTFKSDIVDPLILELKNLSGYLSGIVRESDLDFKDETAMYKAKLEKCMLLTDGVFNNAAADEDSLVGLRPTIATIKGRLQNLSNVISGQIVKTCSLNHILKGQSCSSDMMILTPDNFGDIKKYVNALYSRLSQLENKGYLSSMFGKKPLELDFQDLVGLLYIHEIKRGGEVQKFSAIIILAVLIVVLLYLVFTQLLSTAPKDFKLDAQLNAVKAPTHLKSESTVNYSRWTDI